MWVMNFGSCGDDVAANGVTPRAPPALGVAVNQARLVTYKIWL